MPLPPAAAGPPSNLKPNPDEEPDPESITQVEPCVARCRGRHTPLHLAVEKALGAFEGQKMARPRERGPSTLPIREGGELSCFRAYRAANRGRFRLRRTPQQVRAASKSPLAP